MGQASPAATQLPHQEQGHASIAGHGSVVTALRVPRCAQAIKNPALPAGICVVVFFELAIDGDNNPIFQAGHTNSPG